MSNNSTYEQVRASIWRQVDEQNDDSQKDGSPMDIGNVDNSNGDWWNGKDEGKTSEQENQDPGQQQFDLYAMRKGTWKGKGKGKPFNGQCYNCGEHGHRSADCPKPRAFNGQCNICGKWGHKAADCPKNGRNKGGPKGGKGGYQGQS